MHAFSFRFQSQGTPGWGGWSGCGWNRGTVVGGNTQEKVLLVFALTEMKAFARPLSYNQQAKRQSSYCSASKDLPENGLGLGVSRCRGCDFMCWSG